MEDYVDFDAAFAESEAKPKRVKLFGQTWELPASMPAAAVLKVARYMADGRGAAEELTGGELFDLAGALIPADVLDAWCAKGLDVDKLPQILAWLLRQYMGTEDGQGEAVAPDGAPDSSSNAGDSSKPTSPVTTGST